MHPAVVENNANEISVKAKMDRSIYEVPGEEPLKSLEELTAEMEALEECLARLDKHEEITRLKEQIALRNAAPQNARSHGKCKDIVDYVPPDAARASAVEKEIILGPNTKLVIGPKKIELDAVSPAQWMSASACIMAELLQEPSQQDKVQLAMDYAAYTSRVGILAANFTWRTVIRWDAEYRRKQHVHQFRWGSDSAYPDPVRLIHREPPKPKRNPQSKVATKPSTKRQPSRKPACTYWNKEVPCQSSSCRFRHECSWCGSGAHPQIRHDLETQKATPAPQRENALTVTPAPQRVSA